jgi:hypothetical protein
MLTVIGTGAEQGLVQLDRFSVFADFGRAGIRRPGPVLISVVACVEQVKVIPLRESGTGMGALIVIIGIRRKSYALILPVNQIFGRNMVPVFQAVYRSPGAPLEIKVPDSLMIAKAVGITGQTGHGLHMIGLPVLRILDLIIQIPHFVRAVQDPVTLFACPFFHNAVAPYSIHG